MAYQPRGGGGQGPVKVLKPKTQIEKGSAQERAYMDKLQSDISKADSDYVTWYASNPLDPESERVKMMRYMRHMQIFQACAMPLARGLSADSVLSAVGMYAGVCLFDKNFRSNVQKGVANALYPAVDNYLKTHPENQRLHAYRDKLIRQANDGRYPYTADSAAVQQLAFMRKAYDDMRVPGADIHDISKQCDKAMESVRQMAANDGVSDDEINDSMRFMVGKMMENDPGVARFFSETAFGDVTKDDYHVEKCQVMGEDGQIHEVDKVVWSGEFKNIHGDDFKGGFHVNEPKSTDSHGQMFEAMYSRIFSEAAEHVVDDPEVKSFVDKLGGAFARMTPDEVEAFDGSAFNKNTVEFLSGKLRDASKNIMKGGDATGEWYRRMSDYHVQAMRDDGYSGEVIQDVVGSSISNAAMHGGYDAVLASVLEAAKGQIQASKDRDAEDARKAKAYMQYQEAVRRFGLTDELLGVEGDGFYMRDGDGYGR